MLYPMLTLWLALVASLTIAPRSARAADTLNVYTVWPESLAERIFKAYTARTGVQIRFIRLTSGELVARATAEKHDPRADVIWGAPGDGFAAAKAAHILEPYKPASWNAIAPELKDPEGYYVAVSKHTLIFMSNAALLRDKGLKPPMSWKDLLDPAYKRQIQTADARTSGTALTRILSIYYAFGSDEDQAFEYQKQLDRNVQVYTKSGSGCTTPVALGQAMVCIAQVLDVMESGKKGGHDLVTTFPREGVAAVIDGVGLVRGANNREAATRFIDWTFTRDMQDLLDKNEVYVLPTLPDATINPKVLALMKDAKLLPVDLEWVAKNRKRLVDRWVNEVIKE
ncbi:MAG TPA: ABC transporter substrate-binding protein [Candidatus Methylomirabilis sp.]|nr:ABC transporter substrate-binding protein [Candidatus Methylomirabilis sp.]